MVYLVEMKSGSNFHLYKLSFYHKEFVLKFPPCGKPFSKPLTYFWKGRILSKITNSGAELTFFPHGVISKTNLCGVWNFKPKNSIFHFDLVYLWITPILCVKYSSFNRYLRVNYIKNHYYVRILLSTHPHLNLICIVFQDLMTPSSMPLVSKNGNW